MVRSEGGSSTSSAISSRCVESILGSILAVDVTLVSHVRWFRPTGRATCAG